MLLEKLLLFLADIQNVLKTLQEYSQRAVNQLANLIPQLKHSSSAGIPNEKLAAGNVGGALNFGNLNNATPIINRPGIEKSTAVFNLLSALQ